MTTLHIAHLYPELLNLYADQGNIETLKRRCEWRGIDVQVTQVHLQDSLQLSKYHLVLLGGGSDREQQLIGKTLRKIREEWQSAIESGLPLLAVCGGYQLLGEYYELQNGEKIPGLAVVDMITEAGDPRFIGNIAIESTECGKIVGFENHAGRTKHAYPSLGRVLCGHGNDGVSQQEGIRYNNIFGTYIHGPLLPKNPQLADFILQTALAYANLETTLAPLNDALEEKAQTAFLTRRLHLV